MSPQLLLTASPGSGKPQLLYSGPDRTSWFWSVQQKRRSTVTNSCFIVEQTFHVFRRKYKRVQIVTATKQTAEGAWSCCGYHGNSSWGQTSRSSRNKYKQKHGSWRVSKDLNTFILSCTEKHTTEKHNKLQGIVGNRPLSHHGL